jgi:hypothetical protein
LEEKDKEEEDTREVANEEATKEEAKQVSMSKEEEDETTPIGKLIRKQEVVDLTKKSK